jgi:two-component system response regulator FixJ
MDETPDSAYRLQVAMGPFGGAGREDMLNRALVPDLPTVALVVVDDDAAVRTAVARLLRGEGYEVWTFDSADHLLTSVCPAAPACALVDVRMPGLDGFELMRILLGGRRRVPTILMSADIDASLRERAIREGAAECLEKPFDRNRLVDAIGRVLADNAMAPCPHAAQLAPR